jgi:hypothetical protein
VSGPVSGSVRAGSLPLLYFTLFAYSAINSRITALRVTSGCNLALALSNAANSAVVITKGILSTDFTPSTLVLLIGFFGIEFLFVA